MQRGLTGHCIPLPSAGGENARAFVPDPLPPLPALELDAGIQELVEKAMLALGRLDGLTTVLPDPQIFLYSYVRKEAVLSSQIEGTQSSLSDLLLFEMEGIASVPLDDVQEVTNYVAARSYGLKRLEKLPLSLRLLKEIHGDWEAWLRFFMTGVEETATQAGQTAKALMKLAAADEK